MHDDNNSDIIVLEIMWLILIPVYVSVGRVYLENSDVESGTECKQLFACTTYGFISSVKQVYQPITT